MIKQYISETEDTQVYIVSVSFKLKKYTIKSFSTFDIVKYSNEIIQKCVKTNESYYKIERYGLVFECIEYSKKNEKEIHKIIKYANMIYLDGFYAGSNSFDNFVCHYLGNNNTFIDMEQRVVINLQKKESNDTKYINIDTIVEKIKFYSKKKRCLK